jgi:hypothetical protein
MGWPLQVAMTQCHITNAKVTGTFLLEPVFDLGDVDPGTTLLIVHYGGQLPSGARFARQRPGVVTSGVHLACRRG